MSEKYWVYHEDDYADMGGMELVCFDTKAEAEAFILKRLHGSSKRKLSMYTVIYGESIEVGEAEVITAVRLG